jgi:transcriptional regulator with AAA-type ATPase domain
MPEEAIKDTLEGLTGELENKAENICYVVREIDLDVEKVDSEIKRLQERKKQLNNRKTSLKEYLRTSMEAIDKKGIKTALFTISRTAGRDVALINSEADIPQQFQKVSVSIDKTLLLKALKAGEQVEGAELSKSAEGLRIK